MHSTSNECCILPSVCVKRNLTILEEKQEIIHLSQLFISTKKKNLMMHASIQMHISKSNNEPKMGSDRLYYNKGVNWPYFQK